ncbi:MAG: hypothetical protein Q7T05_04155, partial [Dehalococcoidia bacterium]|nr:hypothetical protein [Dehalococcoidia bacterium]
MTIRTGPSRYASGPVLRIRLAIILSAVLIYFLSFFLIHDFFGDITLAIAVLPVGLAGWLFGVSGGVIIGLAFVPANLLLLSVNAHDWSHTQFGLGSFLVIGVGAGFGLVRDFGTKWKLELALREHSERELTRRTRELATISSIAQALGQSAKIDDVLKVSLDSALGVLDVTRGGIYIVTDDGKNLKLAIQTGLDEQTAEALRILPVGV